MCEAPKEASNLHKCVQLQINETLNQLPKDELKEYKLQQLRDLAMIGGTLNHASDFTPLSDKVLFINYILLLLFTTY